MEIRFARKAAACGILAAGLFAGMAAHANLVTNGGFETGNTTGWALGGDTSFTGVDGASPQAGAFAFFSGSLGGATLSQTLATVAGSTYKVMFWLMVEDDGNGNATPNSFTFDWDGTPITTLTNSPASGYTQYQYLLSASTASTLISFSFRDDPAFLDFDSVDVTVPEPTSLALALGALGGLVAARRRAAAKGEAARTAI